MLALGVALTLLVSNQPSLIETSFSQIAGVKIVGGRLSDLIVRVGPGMSVVRDYSPFWNGWTYWKIKGKKDAMLTVVWEPASPYSHRKIESMTIDLFHKRGRTKSVDPSRLGFWGTIRLGETPTELRQQLFFLGRPRQDDASHLSWKSKTIQVIADFRNGHLYSIAAQRPTVDDHV